MSTENQKRILLVEDDSVVALIEQQCLQTAGYQVLVAETGEKAVNHIERSDDIDLVLMDIDLGPGIDGPEAATQILLLRPLPIVFLSSHTEPAVVARTEEINSYGYIVKGTGDTVLLAGVRMAFQLWDAHQKLEQLHAEKLRQNEYMHQILGLDPTSYLSIDAHGYIRDVNQAYCRATGYWPEELIGQHLCERDLRPDKTETMKHVGTMLEGGEQRFTTEHRHKTGRSIPVEVVVRRIETTEGTRLIEFCRDLSEQFGLVERVAKTEHRYKKILDSMQDVVFTLDSEKRHTGVYGPWVEQTGRSTDHFLGRTFTEILGKAAAAIHEEQFEKALAGEFTVYDWSVKTDTGVRHYQTSLSPIVDDQGQVSEVVGIGRDITELHDARAQLDRQERDRHTHTGQHYLETELYERVQADPAIFKFLREGSLDGLWYWDIQNQEHEWMDNRFWELLGFDPETKSHNPSEWQELIHPDDLSTALENFKAHLADPNHPYDQTVRYKHSNGGTVYVRCRGMAIRDEEGTPTRMLGVHNDLTGLMRAVENERLLHKELNHRVKNNLAIVHSLLALKEMESGGKTDLSDIKQRVETIRLVHETLQKQDAPGTIVASQYLNSILASVFDSSTRYEISGADVELSTKVAVALGLIINELATNAVKHGFPGSSKNEFRVAFENSQNHAGRTHVKIAHSGRPFPDDIDPSDSPSLGLQLVYSLVQQLESTLEITRQPSPVFEFDFDPGTEVSSRETLAQPAV